MTFKQYINTIKNSLKDEVREALDLLENGLSTNSKHYNTYVGISITYSDIVHSEMNGLISYEQNRIERNQTIARLLKLLDNLTAKDFDSLSLSPYEKIDNPILVLVTTEAQKAEQKSFFKIFNFSNVVIQLIDEINWDKDLEEKIDVVIVDSRDIKDQRDRNLTDDDKIAIEERAKLMQRLVDKSTDYYIIFFGNFLFWLNSHRDRCNAANSKFTLYSNTKQLIEFINQYRGVRK